MFWLTSQTHWLDLERLQEEALRILDRKPEFLALTDVGYLDDGDDDGDDDDDDDGDDDGGVDDGADGDDDAGDRGSADGGDDVDRDHVYADGPDDHADGW